MYRTHHCGAIRLANASEQVTLSGWVSRIRDKGFMVWIDLRDRYGITQLVLDQERCSADLLEAARNLGRETVIQVTGQVVERDAKNAAMPT